MTTLDLSGCSFKVLGENRQSHHGGNGTWRKGVWRTVDGPVVPCRNGIHYCKPGQLVEWLGPTVWVFEDGSPDETIDHGDKMVTRTGRIVRQLTTWNDTTARLFAADCAETALQFIPGDHQGPFVAAINAARGFARGEIGDKEWAAAAGVGLLVLLHEARHLAGEWNECRAERFARDHLAALIDRFVPAGWRPLAWEGAGDYDRALPASYHNGCA